MDTRYRGMSQNTEDSFLGVNSGQDVRYLKPHVLSIMKEEAERNKWDNITFNKK